MARATTQKQLFVLADMHKDLRCAFEADTDADLAAPAIKHLYVPESHVKALDLSYPLVIGARGTGKSVWWNALQSSAHREAIARHLNALDEEGRGSKAAFESLRSADIVAGYGVNPELLDPPLPTREEWAALLDVYAPEVIWRTILAWLTWGRAKDSPIAAMTAWDQRAAWITVEPAAAAQRFAGYDRARQEAGRTTVVLFDGIDRSALDWRRLRLITRGLLQCLLDFRGYRSLRLKAFLRPDIADDPIANNFPDASKLKAARVELRWGTQELYTLVWQRLANESLRFRNWTHRLDNRIRWRDDSAADIWSVPLPLRTDPSLQQQVLHEMTGPRVVRSLPYRWLIQELKDATGLVSPRSLLRVFKIASEHPLPDDSSYVLPPKALEAGLRIAAKLRTDEIAEDFPWIGETINALKDLVVPNQFAEVVKCWKRNDVLQRVLEVCEGSGKLPPRRLDLGMDGLRADLIEIGLFVEREDGRVDVPEVARVGFGLRRHGGVRPHRG